VRQNNEFDCGVFMLKWIDEISKQLPPSFATADEVVAHFSTARFKQADVTKYREAIRKIVQGLEDTVAQAALPALG